MNKESGQLHWGAKGSLQDNPVWDPGLVDQAIDNVALRKRLNEEEARVAAEREVSEQRIQEFTGWVTNYEATGLLPSELLDKCNIDWQKGRLLHPTKETKLPKKQEDQLMLLERKMAGKGIRASVFSARSCGLGKLADAAGVEDLRWVMFTRSKNYTNNNRNWGEILKNSTKIVKLRGGWGSHFTVWEDLPKEIINQELEPEEKKEGEESKGEDAVCIAFSTIPYGFADFKNGTEEAWKEVEKKGVLTHEGIRFINAVLEGALRIRKKHGVNVGHSFMGSEILHKPLRELNMANQRYIALAPAIIGQRFKIGNYKFLGLMSRVGGILPCSFQKGVEQALKFLISNLAINVDERVRQTHEAVATMAFQRGTLGKSMAQGIRYLGRPQGLLEAREWPGVKKLRVLSASHDPLVHKGVFGELLRVGLRKEQVRSCGLGHYAWCQTEGDPRETAESQAVREELLDWIKVM